MRLRTYSMNAFGTTALIVLSAHAVVAPHSFAQDQPRELTIRSVLNAWGIEPTEKQLETTSYSVHSPRLLPLSTVTETSSYFVVQAVGAGVVTGANSTNNLTTTVGPLSGLAGQCAGQEFSLNPPIGVFGSSAGEFCFTIESDRNCAFTWDASLAGGCSFATLSADQQDDSICLTLTENAGDQTRSCRLELSVNDRENPVLFDFSQASAMPTLNVLPNTSAVEFDSGGDSESFQVANAGSGDFSWSATSTASWLELSPLAPSGTNSGSFEVSAESNTTGESREAVVTITATSTSGQVDNSPKRITFSQASLQQSLEILPDAGPLRVGSEGGEFDYTVNVLNSVDSDVTIQRCSGVSWISITNQIATANGRTFTLEVDRNDGAERSSCIRISSNALAGQVIEIDVDQDALPGSLEVAPDSLDFGSVDVKAETPVLREILLSNEGFTEIAGSLVLNGDGFSLTGASSYSLGPEQSTTVTVAFMPSEPGPASGTVAFAGTSISVSLAGEGSRGGGLSCSGSAPARKKSHGDTLFIVITLVVLVSLGYRPESREGM